MRSWDSSRPVGNFHEIEPPASYWVDAGSGIFHDEQSIIENESDPSQHLRGMQLWVNIKEEDRAKPPQVQYDNQLPTFDCVDLDGKVVGLGRYFVGDQTAIQTLHPITVALITQKGGTTYQFPVDPTYGGFVLNLQGYPSVGGTSPANLNDVLVLANNHEKHDMIQIETQPEQDAEYFICVGERIQEEWYKQLVARGAVIAATVDEAQSWAPKVKEIAAQGASGKGFAPFGMSLTTTTTTHKLEAAKPNPRSTKCPRQEQQEDRPTN